MEPLEIHIVGKDGATEVFKVVADEAEKSSKKIIKNNDDQKKSVEALNYSWQKFSKDLRQVSQFAVQSSAAIVGSFSAAFASARKDIPAVDAEFKKLGNTLQAMSDNVASATLPTFMEFNKFMSGVANAVSKFVVRNQEAVNSLLKYAGITLIVAGVVVAFAKLMGALISFFRIVATGTQLIFMLATKFTPLTIAITAATLIFALFHKQIIEFLKKIPLIGKVISGLEDTFSGVFDEIDRIMKDMEEGVNNTLERTQDAVGSFVKGVKSQFNSLNANMETFGGSISGSLNDAFSNSIFDAITGRIHGLRAYINAFKEDVLRAFSKLAANEFLGMIFGDKDGTKKGLFSGGGLSGILNGILSIFGLGKKNSASSPMDKLKKETDKVATKFTGLAHNMDMFARSKDRLMENFNKFSRQIESGQIGFGSKSGFGSGNSGFPGPGPSGGFPPPPGDGQPGSIQPIGDDVIASATSLGDSMQVIAAGALAAQAGIQGIGQAQTDAAKQFVIGTALSLAASLGALAISVAAGVSAAATLAAAWIPAAVAASIATFGAAAAAGGASVAGAIGSNQAFASASMQQGMSQAGGLAKLTIPQGVGVPYGATGGIVTSPTLAMIGEAGPEAVVPLGKNGDLGGLDGMGGGIHINMDIAEAKLNTPSNMREFVDKLSSQLGFLIDKRGKRAQGVV